MFRISFVHHYFSCSYWHHWVLSESYHVCRSTVSLLEFGGETTRNTGVRTDQPVEFNDLLTIAKANHDRFLVWATQQLEAPAFPQTRTSQLWNYTQRANAPRGTVKLIYHVWKPEVWFCFRTVNRVVKLNELMVAQIRGGRFMQRMTGKNIL